MTAAATCTVPACTQIDTRLYMVGRRCPDHTPARLAGRPEPESLIDQTRTLRGMAPAAYWRSYSRGDDGLLEQRAHAKGQAVPAARRALWREAS